MRHYSDRWVALLDVLPASRECAILTKSQGAFVHVLGIAADKDEFVRGVRAFCERELLRVQSIEDIEAVGSRLETGHMDEQLRSVVEELGAEYPYRFGVFNVYPRRVLGHLILRAIGLERRGES